LTRPFGDARHNIYESTIGLSGEHLSGFHKKTMQGDATIRQVVVIRDRPLHCCGIVAAGLSSIGYHLVGFSRRPPNPATRFMAFNTLDFPLLVFATCFQIRLGRANCGFRPQSIAGKNDPTCDSSAKIQCQVGWTFRLQADRYTAHRNSYSP